jgi:hypothetical protein
VGFDVLAVRTVHHDDRGLYPVMAGAGRSVEMEELDGADIMTLSATALSVGEVSGPGITQVGRLCPVRAQVMITGARVVVICTDVDRARGCGAFAPVEPVGPSGRGVVARTLAAHRRRTTMLVGHVRFAWLSQVGASPNQGVRGEEQLRLILGEDVGGTERLVVLDLTLPRHVDSLQVAREIVGRAARVRIGHTKIPDEDVAALRALMGAERLIPEAKCFAMYTIPGHVNAHPDQARLTSVPAAVVRSPTGGGCV